MARVLGLGDEEARLLEVLMYSHSTECRITALGLLALELRRRR